MVGDVIDPNFSATFRLDFLNQGNVMSKKRIVVDLSAKLTNDNLAEELQALENAMHVDNAEVDRINNDIKLLQAKLRTMNLQRKDGYVEHLFEDDELWVGYSFIRKAIYFRPFASNEGGGIGTNMLSAPLSVRKAAHSYHLPRLVQEITKDFVTRRNAREAIA